MAPWLRLCAQAVASVGKASVPAAQGLAQVAATAAQSVANVGRAAFRLLRRLPTSKELHFRLLWVWQLAQKAAPAAKAVAEAASGVASAIQPYAATALPIVNLVAPSLTPVVAGTAAVATAIANLRKT